jgi:hypothetical protein
MGRGREGDDTDSLSSRRKTSHCHFVHHKFHKIEYGTVPRETSKDCMFGFVDFEASTQFFFRLNILNDSSIRTLRRYASVFNVMSVLMN